MKIENKQCKRVDIIEKYNTHWFDKQIRRVIT